MSHQHHQHQQWAGAHNHHYAAAAPPPPPPPPCPTCKDAICYALMAKHGQKTLESEIALTMLALAYDPECTITTLRTPSSFKCQQAWTAAGLPWPST